MSKKNSIMYIKPQEPSFISRMKADAGYKEGDSVETKRQPLAGPTDEDFEDRDEEQPVVVVLKPGDVTAEEADVIKARQKEEEEQAPANLSERVVFRPPVRSEVAATGEDGESAPLGKRPLTLDHRQKTKKSKRSKPAANLLSFHLDDPDNVDDS